ncbi:hypothetical protein COCCADRAFT_108388 [Bipolaris zeicola 26-R-13]|uniref:Cytochrome P450 n=1 Tax=Cochliobolus carbonum (strain 26-R-13) TaxID=930089 RepID=W6Y159_COCC2|nr:uncharacterized protein COCCADRAFT_108388 [Bipolaris zeicola 26-R-13]EUC28729.1 hypothetical protein COCCADRAFT_108388 [Bipolaris zeicola 26-R-13]
MWFVGCIVFGIFTIKLLKVGSRPNGYPPGPPTIPILGNLHQFPRKDLHLKFQESTRKYGPLVSLKMGTQTMILCGSDEVVKELMEKRSATSSLKVDMFIRTFSDNLNIAFREWVHLARKMYATRINLGGANNYIPYQEFESLHLLHKLKSEPDNFQGLVTHYATSIASAIVYGRRIPSADDSGIKTLIEVRPNFGTTALSGKLQLADWYPILRPLFHVLPKALNPIKRKVEELEEMETQMWIHHTTVARVLIDSGNPNAMNTPAAFVKAMALYPDVQAKAQEEIDRVIGSKRMPTWSDREHLPYMRAVLEENLRWLPVTLIGPPMPHALSKDESYEGYFLPAGAAIVNCIGTVNHAENRWKNPREFDPSRHQADETLNEVFGINPDTTKRPHTTFGVGRRICPGFHIAQRTLFIGMARILWAFRIQPKLDAAGKPIPIDRDAIIPALVTGPKLFQCNIEPRDPDRVLMFEDAWESSQKEIDSEGHFNDIFFEKFTIKKTV